MKPKLDCISQITLFISLVVSLVGGREISAQPLPYSFWHQIERPLRQRLVSRENLGSTMTIGTVADPTGDTLGTDFPQLDATSFSASFDASTLELAIFFASEISAPDSGLSNAVQGFIDIDADQNPNTGRVSNVDSFNDNSANLGNEFFIDLFSFSSTDGRVDLVNDITLTVVARIPILFTTHSLTARIPLHLLDGDGTVNTATLVGTVSEPTDVVPNAGSLTSVLALIFADGFESGDSSAWSRTFP